jgi:uncharacterized protein YvpB
MIEYRNISDRRKGNRKRSKPMKPQKKVILEVPQILQNPELPNGCEITSLCEILQYYGFPADKCQLADNYLPRSKEWLGADPNLVYMGDPHREDDSPECGFYCFAGPIVAAARSYLKSQGAEDRFQVVDLTGSEPEELFAEIEKGNPFLFWASLHFDDIQHDDCRYPLTDGTIHHVFHQLHCMVCKGVDEDRVYLADPLDFNESVPIPQFDRIYRQLGMRAVVLRKMGNAETP